MLNNIDGYQIPRLNKVVSQESCS